MTKETLQSADQVSQDPKAPKVPKNPEERIKKLKLEPGQKWAIRDQLSLISPESKWLNEDLRGLLNKKGVTREQVLSQMEIPELDEKLKEYLSKNWWETEDRKVAELAVREKFLAEKITELGKKWENNKSQIDEIKENLWEEISEIISDKTLAEISVIWWEWWIQKLEWSEDKLKELREENWGELKLEDIAEVFYFEEKLKGIVPDFDTKWDTQEQLETAMYKLPEQKRSEFVNKVSSVARSHPKWSRFFGKNSSHPAALDGKEANELTGGRKAVVERAMKAYENGDILGAKHCTDWISKIYGSDVNSFPKKFDWGITKTAGGGTGFKASKEPSGKEVSSIEAWDHIMVDKHPAWRGKTHSILALGTPDESGRVKVVSYPNFNIPPRVEYYNLFGKEWWKKATPMRVHSPV